MTLLEIQEYLEKNVKILNHLYEFANIIVSNKDNILSNDIKVKIDIEYCIFSISENIKTKRLDWMNKSYDIISKNYDYVIQRIEQTKNPLLKAIYSEILYYSNEEQYKSYIKQAVGNYYKTLNYLISDLSKKSTENFIQGIINILQKLLYLSIISKSSKIKDIKSLLLKIIRVDCTIPLYHYLIVSTISEMLEYDKIFKKVDFEGIDDIFWNLVQLKFKEKEYHYLIGIIPEYAHKIDQKRGKLSYPWDEILGKCMVKSIDDAKSNFAARHWCINAIKHYTRMNKYTNKIKQLEQKYISYKDKLEFTELNYPIDTKPFIDIAKKILDLESIEIFKQLSASNIFYPSIDNLKSCNSITDEIFATSFLDHNMHTAKVSSTNNELDLCLSNYSKYWQLYQITIQYIIVEGVKNNKLTLQNLLSFLMDYSFVFDLIPKSFSKNKKIRYNWSSSIISIFSTYFKEIDCWKKDPKKYYPFLITITDSFVLKFETWIRHYLSCHKQPTIASIPYEQDIMREKDLNYLLYDEFITEHFEQNDLIYFRYLFIAKEGWNLRNDIAHGNLIPEQYTIELFNLIFFAFLRLAKYKFPTAERNRLIKSKNRYIN